MSPEAILALSAGPELDLAVHQKIFSLPGKPKSYSTKASAAMKLLDMLPVFAARVATDHPSFDANKPYIAGTLAWSGTVNNDVTTVRVKSASWMVALCKAALLHHEAVSNPVKKPAAYVGPRLGIPARPIPKAMPPRPEMTKVELAPKIVPS